MQYISCIMVILLLCALLTPIWCQQDLKMEDLTPEQQQEAIRQRDMLKEMFDALQGKSEEEQAAIVQGFSEEQRQLLDAYHKFRQGGGAEPAEPEFDENNPPSPEQQQRILKRIFDSLEGKTRDEQNDIINKLKPFEKELMDRYNDYRFEQQVNHMKAEKQKAGHCEDKDVYKMDEDENYDYTRPSLGNCTQLSLWDDDLGDDGARALSSELKGNNHLVALFLDTTGIESDGAIALATAIKDSDIFASIDLEGNSIGNAGAKALAEALLTVTNIERVGLAHNEIGDEGADALIELVKAKPSILFCEIHGNLMAKAKFKLINKLVEGNMKTAIEAKQAENDNSHEDEENVVEVKEELYFDGGIYCEL
eukprot:m.166668 g.166668  ORF g.166668 m.166668 type:complete len:366 (+) comp15290_c0_seq3:220-1317(+)